MPFNLAPSLAGQLCHIIGLYLHKEAQEALVLVPSL